MSEFRSNHNLARQILVNCTIVELRHVIDPNPKEFDYIEFSCIKALRGLGEERAKVRIVSMPNGTLDLLVNHPVIVKEERYNNFLEG